MGKSNMNSYEQITNQIIENLEKANSWSDMINHKLPINITGRPYKGINLLLLNNTDYKSRIWGTFNQITKFGGKIRQAEKSSVVAFWSRYQVKDNDEKPKKERWYLKLYRVFNRDQCEFINDNLYLKQLEGSINSEPAYKEPEKLVTDYLKREEIPFSTDLKIPVPYYNISMDSIKVPSREIYKNNDEYYLTLYHELIHSTGHKCRLNRFTDGNYQYETDEYRIEELIAEIGANFLASKTGVNPDFYNSLAYIKGWIPKLKESPRMIVSAASKSEAAVEYIQHGLKLKEEMENVNEKGGES